MAIFNSYVEVPEGRLAIDKIKNWMLSATRPVSPTSLNWSDVFFFTTATGFLTPSKPGKMFIHWYNKCRYRVSASNLWISMEPMPLIHCIRELMPRVPSINMLVLAHTRSASPVTLRQFGSWRVHIFSGCQVLF